MALAALVTLGALAFEALEATRRAESMQVVRAAPEVHEAFPARRSSELPRCPHFVAIDLEQSGARLPSHVPLTRRGAESPAIQASRRLQGRAHGCRTSIPGKRPFPVLSTLRWQVQAGLVPDATLCVLGRGSHPAQITVPSCSMRQRVRHDAPDRRCRRDVGCRMM
jgi:hypothetical protein